MLQSAPKVSATPAVPAYVRHSGPGGPNSSDCSVLEMGEYGGFHSHGGTLKQMVYSGKIPSKNGWELGVALHLWKISRIPPQFPWWIPPESWYPHLKVAGCCLKCWLKKLNVSHCLLTPQLPMFAGELPVLPRSCHKISWNPNPDCLQIKWDQCTLQQKMFVAISMKTHCRKYTLQIMQNETISALKSMEHIPPNHPNLMVNIYPIISYPQFSSHSSHCRKYTLQIMQNETISALKSMEHIPPNHPNLMVNIYPIISYPQFSSHSSH